MKLLIITQKVNKNDPILGFFHRWIEEFSKHCQSVLVICLEEGKHDLPPNVRVLSLGKEGGRSRLKYLWRFYRFIWRERKNYDSVFVHMNQVYAILGAPVWKVLGKKIGLWYAHKSTSLSLKLAVIFVDLIFTPSEASFRLPSSKIRVVGHGIDTDKFFPNFSVKKDISKLLTVGRISPVKNLNIIFSSLGILRENGVRMTLDVVGEPIYQEDMKYSKSLKEQVRNMQLDDSVRFVGGIVHDDLPKLYNEAEIFINLSGTGSLDKAVLEAMACGTKILTSNESFRNLLNNRYLATNDQAELAGSIKELSAGPEDHELANFVAKNHSLNTLIPRIINFYEVW